MSGADTPAAQSPRPGEMNRRTFLKAAAAGTVAVGVGAGSTMPGSPIGRADALPCGGLCVGAVAVAGAGLVTGWLLRETEVVGRDDPPEGLTASALKDRVYNTAESRQSTTRSTIVDNKNIVSSGLKHTLYSDAKMAAVEALNDQKSQSEVQTAAMDAFKSYLTTVKTNFLKSWNEAVAEVQNLQTALQDHADVTVTDVLNSQSVGSNGEWGWTPGTLQITEAGTTVTLPDDSTMEIYSLADDSGSLPTWDPISHDPDGTEATDSRVIVSSGDDQVNYLTYSKWNDVWSALETVESEVNDGIITWVESVYSEVQSGELDTSDLLTARELAELSSEEESTLNQATRDLMALNIPVDLEREATVTLTDSGTTLYGMLGVSGETTLSAGDSIDPSADSLDYYLTYDVSQASGTWDAYNTGVDGGTVTFTSEPHEGVVYRITTTGSGGTDSDTAGETAEVTAEDFSETDSGGSWTTDISGQVETAITEIQSVSFYSQTEETQNETVLLDEPFTIEKFENTQTGEEADSATYEQPSEPESDSNYITQEEWEQREQDYEDLIDKYEESQSGGGGGITVPGVGDIGPGGMVGGAAAIVLAIFGLGKAS